MLQISLSKIWFTRLMYLLLLVMALGAPSCRPKPKTCGDCKGSGRTVCSTCIGHRLIDCGWCAGAGKTKCTKCNGSGVFVEQTYKWVTQNHKPVYKNTTSRMACYYCKKSGNIRCKSCKGVGKISCTHCDTLGQTACSTCLGAGIIKKTWMNQLQHSRQTR